jgi:hypothetical protein
MKKAALIFLTFLYMVSTCGVAWSAFYCCGKLKEKVVFNTINTKDCKGNKAPGCCDTKTFYAKVKDNHSPASYKVNITDHGKFLAYCPVTLKDFNNTTEKLIVSSPAPPLLSAEPVYLALNNFRI